MISTNTLLLLLHAENLYYLTDTANGMPAQDIGCCGDAGGSVDCLPCRNPVEERLCARLDG
jgi:hypothetical protein